MEKTQEPRLSCLLVAPGGSLFPPGYFCLLVWCMLTTLDIVSNWWQELQGLIHAFLFEVEQILRGRWGGIVNM